MNLFRKIVELVGPNVVPGHPRRRPRLRPRRRRHARRRCEARRYKAIVLPGVRFDAGGDAALPRRLRARGRHGPRRAPEARRRLAVAGRRRRGRPRRAPGRGGAPGRDARAGRARRSASSIAASPTPTSTSWPTPPTCRARVTRAFPRRRRRTPRLWNAFTGQAERLEAARGGDRARPRAVRHADRGVPQGRRAMRLRAAHGHGRGHRGAALGLDGELRRAGRRHGRRAAALVGGRPARAPLLGDRHLPAHRRRCRRRSARPACRVFLDFGEAQADRAASPCPAARCAATRSPRWSRRPCARRPPCSSTAGARARCGRRPIASTSRTLLRDGANEIRVDVYNTAINRLAEGGHLPDTAAARRALRPAHPPPGPRGTAPAAIGDTLRAPDRGREVETGDGGRRERDERRPVPVAGRGGGARSRAWTVSSIARTSSARTSRSPTPAAATRRRSWSRRIR